MPASLSDAIKEAYATAPAEVAIIGTLEIRHPSISSPLYLVEGFLNRELTLETAETVVFTATPFKFTLPASGEGGLQELNISIDNIDRSVSDFCELASRFRDPVEIYFRPYLSNDPSGPQMDPPLKLFLKDVVITATQVSARATHSDLINKKFPRELYTRERFPSLGE